MLRRVNIKGDRCRWFSSVHDAWRQGATFYHDPMNGAKIGGKGYVDALRAETPAILQKDKPGSVRRAGYSGTFTFKDFVPGEDGAI